VNRRRCRFLAWKKVDEKTLRKLEEQKAFEDETVEKLTPLYSSTTNPFVKFFIHRIILDTMKHSDTYQTLIDIDQRAVIGEIDRKKMKEELTFHITNESEMLDRAVEISKSVEDKSFRKVLERIVEDEKRHHQILQELFEIIRKEGEEWNRYMYDMFVGGGVP
jgi:bacterioferritin (cytochrome b1)